MKTAPQFRIRPAGWIEDRQSDIGNDVELFARVESDFVAWRDIVEAFNDSSSPLLTAQQRIATKWFRTNGGHISRWSGEKIEYVMRHGLIVFLECEVRKDVYATLGTVSALSAAPYTGEPPVRVPVGNDGFKHAKVDYDLDPTMPNIDLRDVSPIFELHKQASKTLYILRSSVADDVKKIVLPAGEAPLEEDEVTSLLSAGLQRRGYASRGKAEVFGVAKKFGNTSIMMNIGHLWDANEPITNFLKRKKLSNAPSSDHNDWLMWYGFRHRYTDQIVPDKVEMFWHVYEAPVDAGIVKMSKNLEKKNWNAAVIEASVEHTYERICKDVRDGRHAPWGSI